MRKKESKKRVYHAKVNAELSLQFYRDKQGTPNFLITSNPQEEGRDFCTGVDAWIFAENLVNSGRCSVNELEFFCKFFDRVRSVVLQKFNKQI